MNGKNKVSFSPERFMDLLEKEGLDIVDVYKKFAQIINEGKTADGKMEIAIDSARRFIDRCIKDQLISPDRLNLLCECLGCTTKYLKGEYVTNVYDFANQFPGDNEALKKVLHDSYEYNKKGEVYAAKTYMEKTEIHGNKEYTYSVYSKEETNGYLSELENLRFHEELSRRKEENRKKEIAFRNWLKVEGIKLNDEQINGYYLQCKYVAKRYGYNLLDSFYDERIGKIIKI